jgi:hypothetical protein
MSFNGYWKAAREPRYSITLAFPLLLFYEGLSLLLTHSAVTGVRNGADVLLKTIFITFGGRRGLVIFGALLCGAGGWLIGRDLKRRGSIRPVFLGVMLLESSAYAAVFGFVVAGLTAILLRMSAVTGAAKIGALPIGTQLVVSLGAGIYEELLFRVLLVSGLAAVGAAIGWRRPIALGAAIVASAIIFSAFHYVGPYGDTLTLPSFTFRAIAGVMFSGLYVARGFGITAWTHALYDVALALL